MVPGGIYYYLVNDSYVKPDEAEKKYRMSGLTLDENGVINAIDSTLGSGGKTSSTIIPVSFTKSGALDSRSTTADREGFENLIGFVSRRITEAGESIKNGDISLAPYRENDNHNGCSFCDYKDICRFESGKYGTQWRECEKDDIVIKEALYGGTGMD